MLTRPRFSRGRAETDLRSLMNVGPAVEAYLVDLGIHAIDQLARQTADELYRRLQRRIGKACDPCLHDTFSAIIHEARTGQKRPWFSFTPARKRREATGQLDLRVSSRARA
jgi:nucleotidyltransferase/DNA polymerase involved in DNA repair